MAKRNQLAFESLESRHLLSASASLSHFLASETDALPPADPPAVSVTPQSLVLNDVAVSGSAEIPAIHLFLASTGSAATTSSRWDWLAQTVWYVPTENLLAYATDLQLNDPFPIGDQTLWYINQCADGQFSGEAVTKLSVSPVPTNASFTGVVTPLGQIRMEFASTEGQPPIIGIGQMRFVQGAWRAQMQMATQGNSLVTHWAYMCELAPGATAPEANSPLLDTNFLSDEWRWLEGSHWAIRDTAMFGSASEGVFSIDGYRNGYFWGSGTSTQPFNVLGSTTPEGNLLLLVSVEGAPLAVRTGVIEQTSSGGQMALRTYEGEPAIGSAWTIADPASQLTAPSLREFLSSQ